MLTNIIETLQVNNLNNKIISPIICNKLCFFFFYEALQEMFSSEDEDYLIHHYDQNLFAENNWCKCVWEKMILNGFNKLLPSTCGQHDITVALFLKMRWTFLWLVSVNIYTKDRIHISSQTIRNKRLYVYIYVYILVKTWINNEMGFLHVTKSVCGFALVKFLLILQTWFHLWIHFEQRIQRLNKNVTPIELSMCS